MSCTYVHEGVNYLSYVLHFLAFSISEVN